MNIGISGWQRSGKNIIANAIIRDNAIRTSRYPDGIIKHNIRKVYSNSTLLELEKPFVKVNSLLLHSIIFRELKNNHKGNLFFMNEAHKIWNPRLWDKRTKEQTQEMAFIFQDDKQESVLIYDYVPGNDENELLGVDKMIRATTQVLIEITSHEEDIKEYDHIRYKVHDFKFKKTIKGILEHCSIYFPVFDSYEPVN